MSKNKAASSDGSSHLVRDLLSRRVNIKISRSVVCSLWSQRHTSYRRRASNSANRSPMATSRSSAMYDPAEWSSRPTDADSIRSRKPIRRRPTGDCAPFISRDPFFDMHNGILISEHAALPCCRLSDIVVASARCLHGCGKPMSLSDAASVSSGFSAATIND